MECTADIFRNICTQAALELAQADAHAVAGLPEPVPSARFNRRMRRLIPHVKKNRYRRLTTAARIVLVAALLALLALSAVAARHYGFVLFNFGTYGMLEAEKHTDLHITDITYGYIPEGFVLTEQKNNGWHAFADFEDAQGQTIKIDKHGSYDISSVDTEGKNINTVTINGIEYAFLSSAEGTSLYWMDPESGVLYSVKSQLDADILLRIAEDCY
jgi:hypothetical protein